MLKIIYTEFGQYIERIEESVSGWLQNRQIFSQSLGIECEITQTTACLLVNRGLSEFSGLKNLMLIEPKIKIDLADQWDEEVRFEGWSILKDGIGNDDLFVTELDDPQTEVLFDQIWFQSNLPCPIVVDGSE